MSAWARRSDAAEAHPIKPLGHDRPNNKANLICACPNHHAMLDYFVMPLDKAKLRPLLARPT